MRLNILCAILFLVLEISGQQNLSYQLPPQDILDLVDVELAPSIRMDRERDHMVLLARSAYKSIEELSKEELRLAGLRIDPQTNIGSRTNYYTNVRIKDLSDPTNEPIQVTGLPEKPLISNLGWSPDQKHIAFTHTAQTGVELWVVNIADARAYKLTEAVLNANLGTTYTWLKDNRSLLVKVISPERQSLIDTENAIPTGPTISENDGKKAQNRTYQDLLKNKNDEFNFEQLAISQIKKVTLDGTSTVWLPADMYNWMSLAPGGEYIMVNTIKKPFSYLVTYRRFPSSTIIYDVDGNIINTLADVPLIEDLPQGFMACRTGRRSFSWRSDKPATIIYAEALDNGDPAVEADFRDAVFELHAPFNGEGSPLIKTHNRYSYILWGDNNNAIAYDIWWNNRNRKVYHFDPSESGDEAEIIYDLNYQDRYNDPGRFVMTTNDMTASILDIKDNKAFMIGDGFSEEGQFPFLNALDLESFESNTLYRSEYTDKVERLSDYTPDKNQLLVRIESPTDYPNYYFRNLKDDAMKQLSFFENPFKTLQDIEKKVITYDREDGLELSATLYLPEGFNPDAEEKYPMILWAYPREYKDKSSANQNTQNPNEFTYPFWGSPIYWLKRGYVVLDDAAFPIVGEGDEEPNDSFRSQLVANAKAAIDAVDEMGYIDRERVAVGGHSYGAFMVANLLSHSDLFAAGIARSGAYNRTLTPFGFQSEERNYWEAPEVYYTMSPFMHADKMKTPLLLIHGEADNNSGTYPMQSERYFNALKGLGATVRLVMLPKESHGYRAKESILHLLWEQDQWLEKYVKNKNTTTEEQP